jgi:hypothetical protein
MVFGKNSEEAFLTTPPFLQEVTKRLSAKTIENPRIWNFYDIDISKFKSAACVLQSLP